MTVSKRDMEQRPLREELDLLSHTELARWLTVRDMEAAAKIGTHVDAEAALAAYAYLSRGSLSLLAERGNRPVIGWREDGAYRLDRPGNGFFHAFRTGADQSMCDRAMSDACGEVQELPAGRASVCTECAAELARW